MSVPGLGDGLPAALVSQGASDFVLAGPCIDKHPGQRPTAASSRPTSLEMLD
jgi:hypothetical protein